MSPLEKNHLLESNNQSRKNYDTSLPPYPTPTIDIATALQKVMGKSLEELTDIEILWQKLLPFWGNLETVDASIPTYEQRTIAHTMRVAWLSRMLGTAYGLDTEELDELELAALLHDIGKGDKKENFTYQEILTRQGPLSKEEHQWITEGHCKDAVKILEEVGLPYYIIESALYHHKVVLSRKGASPQLLYTDKKSELYTILISIADDSDAVVSPRSYKPGRNPKELLTDGVIQQKLALLGNNEETVKHVYHTWIEDISSRNNDI